MYGKNIKNVFVSAIVSITVVFLGSGCENMTETDMMALGLAGYGMGPDVTAEQA